MAPTLKHGKICYLEIPAVDVAESADFYAKVFNWSVRERGDGSTAFDDGPGQVSGTWVLNKPPSSDPSLIVHIMIDDMEVTLQAIVEHGGEIAIPVGAHFPEITAQFRDPAGDLFGLYQERG